MAGFTKTDRAIEGQVKRQIAPIVRAAALCALLAGPLSLTAKAQVQAQTGSSGDTLPPAQTQPQNPPAQSKTQPTQTQEKKKQKKAKPAPPPKPIKAHVKKVDPKKKPGDAIDTTQSVEPDKLLYERSELDIKKGHYTEGRLSLQTLINTYPDSEYLAKAKLGVADSYYKEGGTSNFTQAIDEYKNFIIFFPFLDEAAYAQMQIGMGHYRMMEKPDRDTTQAIEAEQEFQTFLLKYPQSPLVPKAEQYLRNTQEVLADGEYKIARFYYLKQDYPASAARLFEVTERYPLYSQSDQALWMLGDVYDRARRVSRNEDEKNHWADLAGKCYDRILQDYPLSRLASDAKSRLTAMGMSVPATDPNALARMKQQQLYEKEHEQNAALRLPMTILKSGPDLKLAAHIGSPNLNPPDDAISARDVLKQGAAGPDFDIQSKPPDQSQAASTDSGTPVEAVPTSPNAPPPGSNVGVQIIGTTPDPSSQPATSQTPAASGGTVPTANPPTTNVSDPAAANSGTSTPTTPPTGSADPAVPAAVQGGTVPTDLTPAVSGSSGQPPAPAAGQTPAQANGQANGQTPAPANAQGNSQQTAKGDKADSSTESSSKKKKGIKKIIPWG